MVRAPRTLQGVEIEARPVGYTTGPLEHVAVVARPLPDGDHVHSAVFAGLQAGTYELYVRPRGPVRLTVSVTGGQVADAVWPSQALFAARGGRPRIPGGRR